MESDTMTQNIQTHPVVCGVCGSADAKPLFSGIDRLHGFKGTFQYVQCKNCGLVYMNPQISFEDVKAFYPCDYAPYKSGLGDTRKSKKISKSGLKKNRLPKPLLQKLNKNSSVLDVGCGNGKFLGEIKQVFGCSVYGVDMSEEAVKTAKEDYGIDVFLGVITAAPFPPGSFDVITARQYLEHVYNPQEVLQVFFRLLKPGGLCLIYTPNFNSFNAKLFKNRWYALDCPRHLYLYAPKTIETLLRKAGFSLTGISHDKSSKNLINSLQYYFYENNCSPEHRDKVKNSLMIKSVFSLLSRIFALLKRSDNMIVLAEKCISK